MYLLETAAIYTTVQVQKFFLNMKADLVQISLKKYHILSAHSLIAEQLFRFLCSAVQAWCFAADNNFCLYMYISYFPTWLFLGGHSIRKQKQKTLWSKRWVETKGSCLMNQPNSFIDSHYMVFPQTSPLGPIQHFISLEINEMLVEMNLQRLRLEHLGTATPMC